MLLIFACSAGVLADRTKVGFVFAAFQRSYLSSGTQKVPVNCREIMAHADEGPLDYVLEYTYLPVAFYSFVIFGVAACFMPYISWWFVPKYRTISSFERFDWNSRIVSMFHSVLVSFLGVYNVLYDKPTWDDTIWGTSYLPRATIAITTGYIASDLILMFVGFPVKESFFYILHHFAVFFAYTANVFYGPLTYFGNIRVIAEFSTPFVNLRWMLHLLGYKETKLYLYNGFAMLGAFFAVRVGIVPFFYYILLKSFIEEGLRRLPLWMTLTCLISSAGLDIINVYWFFKMARGAYRMLHKRASKSKSDQNSDSHVKSQ